MAESPSTPSPTPAPPASSPTAASLVVLAVIAVAIAVGAYALLQANPWGQSTADSEDAFELDLTSQMEVPERLLSHVETGRIDVSPYAAKALATASDGRIFLAAENAIQVIDADGAPLTSIPTEQTPSCIAVATADHAEPERVYAAVSRQVLAIDRQGKVAAKWQPLNDKAVLTAIALTPNSVLVADAGNRCVIQYDCNGSQLGVIGAEQPDRDMPGFVIPSPYFDLVIAADETVAIVNPGMRRIETFTWNGQLQSVWGSAGSRLQDFFGCCNPSHLDRLPDGRFVTSEKGIPRVKIYSDAGELDSVVAGPRQLEVSESALGDARVGQDDRVFDIAVGPEGRILVLDPWKQCIRIFEPKNSG